LLELLEGVQAADVEELVQQPVRLDQGSNLVTTDLFKKVLDSLFSVLDRVRIFLLERHKGVLRWKQRDKEKRVLYAKSLSKQVKIAVSSLNLSNFVNTLH